MNIEWLNKLEVEEANAELGRCCASSIWVDQIVAKRPYESVEDLFKFAQVVWSNLSQEACLEAFAAHPRIGTKEKVSNWSAAEQSGMREADESTQDSLERLNQVYYEKNGFVFLICATGKSAAEMHDELTIRIDNSTEKEFEIAKSEQAKIMRIRLEKMLCQD